MKTLTRPTLAQLVSTTVPAPFALDVVDATVAALGSTLPTHAAQHMAHSLGLPRLPSLHFRGPRPVDDVDDLVGHVVVATGTSSQAAREAVVTICAEIAECWGPADAQVVMAALPPNVAALFVARERAADASPALRARQETTLAAGQPGTAHSIADARRKS